MKLCVIPSLFLPNLDKDKKREKSSICRSVFNFSIFGPKIVVISEKKIFTSNFNCFWGIKNFVLPNTSLRLPETSDFDQIFLSLFEKLLFCSNIPTSLPKISDFFQIFKPWGAIVLFPPACEPMHIPNKLFQKFVETVLGLLLVYLCTCNYIFM